MMSEYEQKIIEGLGLKDATPREQYRVLDFVEGDLLYDLFEYATENLNESGREEFETFLDTDAASRARRCSCPASS